MAVLVVFAGGVLLGVPVVLGDLGLGPLVGGRLGFPPSTDQDRASPTVVSSLEEGSSAIAGLPRRHPIKPREINRCNIYRNPVIINLPNFILKGSAFFSSGYFKAKILT